MANTQMATSVRDRAASELGDIFKTSYDTSKFNEMNKVSDIYQEYSGDIESVYNQTSSNLAAISEALVGFGDTKFTDNPEWFNQVYSSDITTDENGLTTVGEKSLTTKGRQYIDELLNKYINEDGFDYYLRSSLKNEKLADWYGENSDLVRELVGGLEYGDYSFTTGEDDKRTSAETAREEAKTAFGEDFEEKDFKSFAEEEQYYKTQTYKKQLDDRLAEYDKVTNVAVNYEDADNKTNNIITTGTNETYKITGYNTAFWEKNWSWYIRI